VSFESRETSRHDGRPVECFRVRHGSTEWRWTSADAVITIPGIGTFTPATVSRSGQVFGGENQSGALELRVPLDNPLRPLVLGYPTTVPIRVGFFLVHRGDEADPVTVFEDSEVISARAEGDEVVLLCQPETSFARSAFPVLRYTSTCFHNVFDGGCKLIREAFEAEVTITAVDGHDVVSSAFALQPDGYYRRGRIILTGAEARTIVHHAGDRVTLTHPFEGLVAPAIAVVSPGCDGTAFVCATRYANTTNRLSWDRIPSRDIHGGYE
jgi:hypothetical protein